MHRLAVLSIVMATWKMKERKKADCDEAIVKLSEVNGLRCTNSVAQTSCAALSSRIIIEHFWHRISYNYQSFFIRSGCTKCKVKCDGNRHRSKKLFSVLFCCTKTRKKICFPRTNRTKCIFGDCIAWSMHLPFTEKIVIFESCNLNCQIAIDR